MTKPLDDDGSIRTADGVVPYEISERISIMLESGATLAEAQAQAAREEQARGSRRYVPGQR